MCSCDPAPHYAKMLYQACTKIYLPDTRTNRQLSFFFLFFPLENNFKELVHCQASFGLWTKKDVTKCPNRYHQFRRSQAQNW